MSKNSTKELGQVIQIDDDRVRDYLKNVVGGSVEDTLNAMLDEEAERLCNASRYERTEARGVQPQQEDLCHHRGVANAADRRRASLCLSRRHRVEAELGGEVRNVSLLVATSVNGEGYREILGICEGGKGQPNDRGPPTPKKRKTLDTTLGGVQNR
jgi:hypothetical protein